MDSTQPTASMAVEEAQPFEIHAADSMLEDLRERLARTRFIDALGAGGWQYGFDTDYLRELVRYWREDFDWRAHEAAMNRFAQFRATVGGTRIHFIHERGRGHHSMPIVLTHGFPDSVFRFAKIIPMLTDPPAHGGDAADAFDVIAPSLPGYGFSERPGGDGVIFRVGDVWHELMTGVLGYERFAAHGGDWGSTVTELLARDHAHAVIGIHLTDVPFFHAFRPPNDPSATEQTYLDGIARFGQTKGAYASVQGAQPQALAVGMSGTINSSFGPYYDFAQAGAMRWIEEKLKAWRGSVLGAGVVPAGFAMFPKDLSSPPREWAERFFDVRHWTAMPRGGHFAALEEPELLVQDIRTFFRPFR